MIDWTTLIVSLSGSLIGGGVLFTTINYFIFFKENKSIKKNETKQSKLDVESKETENDSAQIDLGKKYIESSMEIIEMMKKANLETNDFNTKQEERLKKLESKIDKIDEKVDALDKRTIRIEKEQTIHTKFLNGQLAEFKNRLSENEKSETQKDNK